MHTKTRTLALLAALLLPLHVMSATTPAKLGTGTIRIADTIAGLGAEATLAGFPADTGKVDVVVVPPSEQYLVFSLTLNAMGGGSLHIPGMNVRQAGTYQAFVGVNGGRISPEISFTVLPDTVDTSASGLSVQEQSIAADGRDAAHVSVAVRDRFRNPLPHRPVELLCSVPSAKVSAEAKETDAQGTIRFTVTTTVPGTLTLRATDLLSDAKIQGEGTVTADASAPVTHPLSPYAAQVDAAEAAAPTFGPVQSFEVKVAPPSLKVDAMGDLTIRAIDTNGQTVEDFTGTVRISSPTDTQATLPGFSGTEGVGEVTFEGRNLGVKTMPLSVSFRNRGRQTVKVEDLTDPAHPVRGTATVAVTSVSGPTVQGLTITSPAQNAPVNAATVTVTGTAPPFTNVEIDGGMEKASGASDDGGRFSLPVALDTNQNEFTLFIRDDAGDDATLHLVRDTEPPPITSAVFSPEKPEEGANTLLVVQSEPGLPVITMQLLTDNFPLQEDPSRPGTYQTTFIAPRAGSYQPSVTATDTAGNPATVMVSLVVEAKKLPMVTNVKAVPRNGSVDLSWDPVTGEPLDKYRIYIGEKTGDYAWSLDTPDATRAAATVTGLQSGTPYFFAVTAVRGDRESEKSAAVSARVLGLALNVTPQPEALLLEWSFPSAISLQSFIIEYGVSPDALTEKRTIPGGDIKANEKRSVVLRDLLPNLTYYVRMTPIAVTGDPLTDLVATANGTTGSYDGAHFAAPDQTPPFVPNPGTPAPQTGLPFAAWGTAVAAAAVLTLFLLFRRSSRRTTRFLRVMEARYHQ